MWKISRWMEHNDYLLIQPAFPTPILPKEIVLEASILAIQINPKAYNAPNYYATKNEKDKI